MLPIISIYNLKYVLIYVYLNTLNYHPCKCMIYKHIYDIHIFILYSYSICICIFRVYIYIHIHDTYSICIYIYTTYIMYMYIYIHINCTVNMELGVSETSVFPTNFGWGHFQENLFSLEKTNVVTEDFIWR